MRTAAALLAAALALAPLAPAAAGAEESFTLEPFGRVTLYPPSAHPAPGAPPPHLVIFVSGDGGWKLGVVDMARELAGMGAAVAGIDITRYLRTVTAAASGSSPSASRVPADRATLPASAASSPPPASGASGSAPPPSGASSAPAPSAACFNPGQDFADLGREAARRLGLDPRKPPILVGYSSGATLVYAALVQAPPGAYAGAISLGFCPDLIVNMPICKGNGLTWERDPHHKGVDFLPSRLLEVPWVALQGDIDKICTPADTRAYVHRVPHGELVWLEKVGHGFSVPRRWLPQLKASYARVARAASAAGR